MGGNSGIVPQSKEGIGSWDWPPPGTGAPPTTGDPVSAPTTPYKSQSAYTTPTYALNPYSMYSGLAQQINTAMNPGLTPYAAPRSQITDMLYAPWNQLWQPPGTPLPGTLPGPTPGEPHPGVPPTGPGTIPNQPPPPPPPPGSPPPPTLPNDSTGGGYPPGTGPGTGAPPPSTRPPPTGTTGNKMMGGGPLNSGSFEMGLPNTGPEGMDLGQVLFPNGPPNKIQHGGGLLKTGGDNPPVVRGYNPLMGGGFGLNLPNTGPEGMDLGQVLFPNGAPRKIQHGRGLLNPGRS